MKKNKKMKNMNNKKTMKEQLAEVYKYIWWGNVSIEYFGESKSWISKKLRGISFDGIRPTEFTEKEKAILKDALRDIAKKAK